MASDLVRVRHLTTLLVAAPVLAAALCSTPARAASADDRAAARQHLNQAQELKKKGQLAEACRHLEEVERLDPKLPTLMDLAECTEQLGKLVEAQNYWSLARDRARHDEKPQSKARAEARLAAVQKRVAHLTLQLAASASGAQVSCDDAPLDAGSLGSALPMNPGDHLVVVKLAGHDDAKYPLKLAEADDRTLPIAAGPATATEPAASSALVAPAPTVVAPPVTAPIPPPSPAAAKSSWSGERTAGLVLGSLGLVAVGAGTALCIIANRDSEKHAFTTNERLAAGGISIAGGSVLLLSGLVLLAGGPGDEASQHAQLTLSPAVVVTGRAAQLGAAGAF